MDFVKKLLDEYQENNKTNEVDDENKKVAISENKVSVHFENIVSTSEKTHSEEINSEKNEQRGDTVEVSLL